MPSLIQQLAQAQTQAQLAPTQRKRVVVYAPGRGLANGPVQQQQPQGPVPRPSGTRPSRAASTNRGSAMARAEAEFLNSPTAQKQRQEKAQKEAEDAAYDDQAWYEKGLGAVLGNPVVSTILKPLSVLSTPGKAVVAGIEAAMEHTPLGHITDLPGPLKAAMAFNPATATLAGLSMVDTARTEADDRNFWEKVKPDSDYGFGQLLDPDLSPWISRPAGFLGDVATDPFTYVAPGATRMAGAIEKGARVAEAAEATEKAGGFFRQAARHAVGENFEEAAKAQRLGAEQEAIARRATADAEKVVLKKVPIHQGRKARAALQGELSEHAPDLLKKYEAEIARGGERGFNTIRDPAVRELLGLNKPELRFAGGAVPKTEGLVTKGAQAGGFLRAQMNKAPILAKAGEAFAPKGLEDPLKVLTRGKKGDVLRSATVVRIQNLMRRGTGEMEGRGNKALTDMVRQLKELGGREEIQALFRQAETDPNPNILNKFFGHDLPALYEKVAGRGMGVKRNRDTYIPHMHTPEGRRFLSTLDADMVEKDLGFVKDDLLEGSKYLEKSRKLAPDTPGVPKEFQIGDRGTITLTDGTVDEINDELGRLFPEFKGKFYEDDPVRIGEAYVSSVSRQAGRDLALDRLAESKNPLVREVTGDILEDVNKRNEFLRRNPVLEKIREGYTKGQRLVPIKPKGDMPVTPHDDLFATTRHVAESKANRDAVIKEGGEYVAAVKEDVSTRRTSLTDSLKKLRATLKTGLTRKEKELNGQILAINASLGAMDVEIAKLGPLTTNNIDEMVATQTTIAAQKETVRGQIKKIRDRYGKKIPRDEARNERTLNETLTKLEAQERKLEGQHAQGTVRLRAEAKARREALEAPVKEAKAALDQVEAKFKPRRRVSPERVQEANVELRQDFVTEDLFDAERQLYVDEFKRMHDEGIPIRHTTDGRQHPETTAQVQAGVVKTKKAKAAEAAAVPPVAAAPVPPPATPEQRLAEAMKGQQAVPAAAPIEVPPEVAAARGSTPPPAQTPEQLAKNRQQGLKTANKMVKNGEKRVTEATTRLTEATAAGANPEDIRKLEYGVKQAQDRLKEARTFQQDAVRDAAAAPTAAAAVPEAPFPFPPDTVENLREQRIGLNNAYKDAVAQGDERAAGEIEQQLDENAAEIRKAEAGGAVGQPAPEAPPAPPAAPTKPPPAPVPPTKLVKKTPELWESGDDFRIIKRNNNSFQVTWEDQDFGNFKSLKEAREHVEFQQEIKAERPAWMDEAAGEPAATPVAATPPEPEVTPPPAPEPAAAVPAAETTKPRTQRLRYKWETRDLPHNRVEVGKSTGNEGWSIVPYEEVAPRSQWAEGADPLTQPRTGKTRYVAQSPPAPEGGLADDALSGRTFASAREAKLAVQDHLFEKNYIPTAAERRTSYEAAVKAAEEHGSGIAAHYENLSGVREIPPSGLTPEQAAANRARVEAVPQQQRPVPYEAPGLTPEGENLEALRAQGERVNRRTPGQLEWQRQYDNWQTALTHSKDTTLGADVRKEWAKQARTLGAEFTQRNGRFYTKNAAQKIMIQDIEWQLLRDADPEYQKALRNYEQKVTQADNQVEAMVYTKHFNPETGTEEVTRLPSGSMKGFLEEEGVGERVAVPVEPPKTGEVVPTAPPRPPRGSNYGAGERAADRAQIERGQSYVLGPHTYEYDEMRIQAEGITKRLDNSARNEDELRALDDAAKQAYTGEVKQADDAVRQAKAAEREAQLNMNPSNYERGQAPPANAGQVYDAAVVRTREAVAAQTEARQAWMEADRAWKAKLAERDEYLRVREDVASAERAIAKETNSAYDREDSLGRPIPGVIDQVRRGESPTLGGSPIESGDLTRMIQKLQRADIELDDFEQAGYTWMTDTERRNEAGKLVGIDKSMRDLLNQRMEGAVTRAEAILPSKYPQVGQPGRTSLVRGTGQEPLAARAYAESFLPTEPAAAGTTTTVEPVPSKFQPMGKVEGEVTRPSLNPQQPYKPVTERQRVAEMEAAAERADALNIPLQEAKADIARQVQEAQATATRGREAVAKLAVERDKAFLPLKQQAQTLTYVDDALNNKAKLIPQREQVAADAKVIVDQKITKKADVVKITDDLGKVAAQNPELLDDNVAMVEGLLHDAVEEANVLTDNDLTWGQVQKMINDVSKKGDNSPVDVFLTTTGKNWKMLYDASGPKRAVLEPGDIILEANLHKQFNNVYEITKDRVLFGRTLNALTNLFKTYATLSPGFHVRNALSAIFMNATDGVALKTQYHAAGIWREMMKAENSEEWLANLTSLRGFTGDQIRDAFAATYGTGAGGRFTEAGFAEAQRVGHWTDLLAPLQRNKLTRFSQRVGERVEGSVRLAMALDSMKQGDSVESAIQRINRVHFDYGEISQLDANMKRIIPFWTFMSRNMPLQVSQMWTHPQVYLGYQRFVKNFSVADEEYTPEYWTKAGAWNTGLKVPGIVPEAFGGGLPISLQPDLGFTRLESDLKDYEDFLSGKRLGGVLSVGNPLVTGPVEYTTRTDLFTGQKFEEGETVPVSGLGWPIKMLAKVLGQTKDGEVDAAFMNLVRAVNPIQDRETRLLPQLTGGDPEAIKRQGESIARFIGVPGRVLTPKQQDNEFFRRYYDQLDAAKLQQKRLQRQAG